MNVFLDTSTLFKLYYSDEDKGYTYNKIKKHNPELYISRLTEIEFTSIAMRKYREKRILKNEYEELFENFQYDKKNDVYNFYDIDESIIDLAKIFLKKYSDKVKLFSPDAIQLATAFSLFHNNKCNAFSTSDNLLKKLFRQEDFPIF